MAEKKVEPRAPRGMRDILPEKMIRREYVFSVIRQVFEEFGFEPLHTPAIELEETLIGKYGPDAERLFFNVSHPGGGEKLGLRYDLTLPLCRVVAQYPELLKPFKRYQIALVWRAERPQKGRYRELYQCDADTVGSASMMADAETLNVIYEILTRLGFKSFVTYLGHRQLILAIGQYAGVPADQLAGLYRSIDKLDRIGLAGVEAELRKNEVPEEAIARMIGLLQVTGSNQEVLAQLKVVLNDYPLAMEGIADLEQILDYLRMGEIPESFVQVSPALVRGLEYYTGPVYETFVTEPKIGSITGGGRYDELVGMFGPRSYPATGTTMGIERIIDVMDELNLFPPEVGMTVAQVLVTQFSPELVGESLKLARELRVAGWRVELYFENDPLGKQLRYADRKGIPYLAIVGPDEVAAGSVALRNLATKEQVTVARSGAAAQLEAWSKRP